jgi:hypothetical protein
VNRESFRLDRQLTVRELGLSWLALAVLAGVAYWPLMRHGGFHLDDWWNGAETLYPPGGRTILHSLDQFQKTTLFRPVLVLYVPLTYVLFGLHQHVFLAWAVALALAGICLFYGVLRRLGVPWIHSLVIAGLVLIFPWFDSTRLMPSAGVLSLSIFFLMAGIWLALIGLDRGDRRFHWAAATFYLLSILSYEITLPLIAALGFIYLIRAGWQEARWRWAIDLAVVVVGGTWNLIFTARTTSGVSGDLKHLHQIVDGGGTILGQTALPTRAPQTTLVLIGLAVVLGAGLAVWWSERGTAAESGSGWGLRAWLMLAGGGIAVFVLGWVIFIPADPYYTPAIYGVTNRVNGMAGFGTVITVYAALGVFGTLVGRVVRGVSLAPIAITLLLAVALGIGYGTVLHRHIGMWNAAYVAEEKGFEQVTNRYPTLPPGTTVIAADYPANETLGVPIFSSTWDFDGMLKLHYKTAEVTGYPLLEGWTLHCLPEGVQLDGEGIKLKFTRYGKARLMNLAEETAYRPTDRRSCEAAIGKVEPGPLYLAYDY